MNPSAVTPSPARRLLAALLALCVFAIAALTASPALHAALHGAAGHGGSAPAQTDDRNDCDHGDCDSGDANAHTCAITLYAAGAETPAAAIAVPRRSERAIEVRRIAVATKREAAGEHRHPPACGPPGSS